MIFPLLKVYTRFIQGNCKSDIDDWWSSKLDCSAKVTLEMALFLDIWECDRFLRLMQVPVVLWSATLILLNLYNKRNGLNDRKHVTMPLHKLSWLKLCFRTKKKLKQDVHCKFVEPHPAVRETRKVTNYKEPNVLVDTLSTYLLHSTCWCLFRFRKIWKLWGFGSIAKRRFNL